MYPLPLETVQAAFNGTIAVEIGDLMYQATDDSRPVSSQADTGTESGNVAAAAPNFIGVARERKLVTETAAGYIDIAVEFFGEFPCVSNTFEVGDLLTLTENGHATHLVNDTLAKTTDASVAIGIVARRYGSATTTVLCLLRSRVIPPQQTGTGAISTTTIVASTSVTTPVLTFSGATTVPEIHLTTNLADALSIEDTAGDLMKFDTTTANQVLTITPPTLIVGTLGVTGIITATGGIIVPGAVDLAFTGTTGQPEIVVPDNLADALSIKDGTGGADIVVFCTTNGSELVTFTPRTVHSGGLRIPTTKTIEMNAAAAAALSVTKLVVASAAMTAMADNATVNCITVTIPNANHSAVLDLMLLGAVTGGASTRCGRMMVAFTRVADAVAVAVAATLDDAQIATSAAGETLTMTAAVSAVTGAAGASNSFQITLALNTSAGATAEAMIVAELLNLNGTGVTIAAT
jgi:hypothetical protein